MKRLFTFDVFRAIVTLTVLYSSATASAEDNKWHYFYDEFQAYPSGSGLIYVSNYSDVDASTLTDDDWKQQTEMSLPVYKGSGYHDFYIYTKPLNGAIPLGVCEGTRADELSEWSPKVDDNGAHVLYNQSVPLRYTAHTTNEASDEASCIASAPILPERCTYALFTYVAPRIYNGGKNMGSVAADKDINSLGDLITLTATPKDERCHFDYWIQKSNGTKISDNPLKVQVTGAEEYYAHFSCDSAVVINFPEEGGYRVWYNDVYYSAESDNFTLIKFAASDYGEDVTTDDTRYAYINKGEFNSSSYGAWIGAPIILYGKGEATLLKNEALGTFSNISTTSATRWSGEGVNIADLPVDNSYYSTDLDNQTFNLIPETQTAIAPNTMYVAVPKTSFLYGEEAPSVIYWSKDAAVAAGISEIDIKAADKNGGHIYNVNGMQMKSVGKGIYILNGKKYLNK